MNNHIVFLHGFLGDPKEFERIFLLTSSKVSSSLKNLSYTAIDLNLSPDYSLKGMSQFVKEKLEALNITQAHFWGYSMGGRVLLEFYKHYPDMCLSLTLESTSPGIVDPREKKNRVQLDADWAKLISKSQDEFLEKWYSQVLFQSFRKHKDFQDHLKLRYKTDASSVSKMLLDASPGVNPHHFDVIENISVPTLALVGQFDEKYVQIWTKLIDKNPNIAIRIIPNSGHVIHLEQPQLAVDEFEAFINN